MHKYATNKTRSPVLHELEWSLENLIHIVDTGIEVNGKHISDNFLEDDALSQKEISFLVSLKEEFLYLRQGLYSEETGQVNPDLTLMQFEEIVKEYIGSEYAFALESGTASLFLSMVVTGIGHGDEVITTPMTYRATANAIIHTGAKPVFVDVFVCG